MNKVQLDKMIDYIENHLTEPINYNKLAQIVGLPPYILQRIFQFLTNMSINEYVKKRRLSKAYEELKEGKFSITAIALAYGYASNSSFCRTFKKYFASLPKEVKKHNERIAFPKPIFSENLLINYFFRYRIENINTLHLYGKKLEISEEYYSSQIYEFYNELKKQGFLKAFKKKTWYGITLIENEKEYYFVGSTQFFPKLEQLKIQKSKYLLLDNIRNNQNDIVNAEIKMHKSFIPSTNVKPKKNNIYEIEIYEQDKCRIGVPIL